MYSRIESMRRVVEKVMEPTIKQWRIQNLLDGEGGAQNRVCGCGLYCKIGQYIGQSVL